MHIVDMTSVFRDGLTLAHSQSLWKQFCEAQKRQSREGLRNQIKAEARKMQRDKATFSVNLEHHFAPLLYAKILLWELYAVTCPQPVSPSTSGMTEKDCKEQLKALLPILHAYVVFSPGDSISRISLHAAWLYTHVTMHIFKDKKLSAEQAEAIQEIRSTLQSVRSTLITEPTVDKILYLKPEKEMVDPNPSPDDKTFEGLVACCTFDDKKIVEKLLRMAVQASIMPSKSKKEGKEGSSKVAEVAEAGKNAEGSPAEEKPQGNAASSRDKDSQGQPSKSKGGKGKQQGALKQQGGEAGSKARGDPELKKRIMESEAKLQQYIEGCKVKALPKCSEERLEAFLDVTSMPVSEFRQKYITAACGASSVEAKQAADLLKDARALVADKIVSHFLATGSWMRWSHKFMALVGLQEEVVAAERPDPNVVFPEEAMCDPDTLLKAILQHAPIFEPQPESPESPEQEQQQQQQQQQAAATAATSNGGGPNHKGKGGQPKVEPKDRALQLQQQQKQAAGLPQQQLKSALHHLLYGGKSEEEVVQAYRGNLNDVDQPPPSLVLEGKLASWVEAEVQKRRGNAGSNEPLSAQFDRALWRHWAISPGVCEDGNLLSSYSQIWTSTEDKLFAELNFVDSGLCCKPELSMFTQGLWTNARRQRDKEEEVKADQRLWLMGLAVLGLQDGTLPLPMDKRLSSFTPLTLLLNQAINTTYDASARFMKMAEVFWNEEQYSREAQEVMGLSQGQMRTLLEHRMVMDERQILQLPEVGTHFRDASAFDEPDFPPYPSSHGVSLESDIDDMEEKRIMPDGVLKELCQKWQREAHKLLRTLLGLKHNSPALPRALSWFLGCGGRLTPALRHNTTPPPSIDLEDEDATWAAIASLPLVELVQLRQFLLQQVGRRSWMIPAVHQHIKCQQDLILAQLMVIEKKREGGATSSKGGKGSAKSEESTFIRLSREAYRAFCYHFHWNFVSGTLTLDRSKGPLRASLADMPCDDAVEEDIHSLLNPSPDIPFAEDGSELAEHVVFDKLLYAASTASPDALNLGIITCGEDFVANVQSVSSAACWLVKMKQHAVDLCTALHEAEEHVPKLLIGLKRGWTESLAASEDSNAEDAISPPLFSPDWGLGLEDEESSKVSSADCLEGKQAMLELDAAIAKCKAIYTQAHAVFFQHLADNWNRAYKDNTRQQSAQHVSLMQLRADIDKQEAGAKSNRAPDKDKKGKDAKLAKLTEELKATSSYQASLKLEQRKITDVFQQYSQESQVWASRSEQAHMALHQRMRLDLSGRAHSSYLAMTYAGYLLSSSSNSDERVYDVQSTPVYWPALRDSGYKQLKSMLAATADWELGVDLYGAKIWQNLMDLIVTPFPGGALHAPLMSALPTLVDNLLSKYAEYNQAELLQLSQEAASNETGIAPTKGKDQDKKAKEKRKLEAEWQRKQALKLKEEKEEEERQRQARAAATAGKGAAARVATPTDLPTEDEALLDNQYLEEAAKYSAATPNTSSHFGATADGWESPGPTFPIPPPPPPPPRRSSRQGQQRGTAGTAHPQPTPPPTPPVLSAEELLRRNMRAAGFDPDDEEAFMEYAMQVSKREHGGEAPRHNTGEDGAYLQEQALATSQSTDPYDHPTPSLPNNMDAESKANGVARGGSGSGGPHQGSPAAQTTRGGAGAGGGGGGAVAAPSSMPGGQQGRPASRPGGRQGAGSGGGGGGGGIGAEREGRAGSAGTAGGRSGAQAGTELGGGASRRGGGGSSRGSRGREQVDNSQAAGVVGGGQQQGFKGQELGRGGSRGAPAGRGGGGRDGGLGGGGGGKPGVPVPPPPPPPPPKPHQVPGAEWEDAGGGGGGAANKKMSKKEKDRQRQRQREELREAQRQSAMAAGQPFNASSPTPPSHLSTDRVAIPPPHKPAPPKPSPVNQGAGPFALQHKAAAPPAPSPAPLPGAWASAEDEEPQPQIEVEDEGPVRDPWATAPEDEEVASTLSSSTHPAATYMQPPTFPDHSLPVNAMATGPSHTVATSANSAMSPQSSMQAAGGVLRPPFPAPLHPFNQQHEHHPHYPLAPLANLHNAPPALAAALRARQGHLQPPPHLQQQQQQHHPMVGVFPMHPPPPHMQQPQPGLPVQQQPAEDEEDKEDDLMALLTGGASEEPPQQQQQQQQQQQPPSQPYPGYSAHYPNFPHQGPSFYPPHPQGPHMPYPPHEPLGGFPHAAHHPQHGGPWGPYADVYHHHHHQQQQHEAGARPYLQGPYPGAEDSANLQGNPEASHHSTGSALSPEPGSSGSGAASKTNPWGFTGAQGRKSQADSLPELSPDAFPSLSASAAAPRKGPQGPWGRPHMAAHQGDAHPDEEEDEELQRVLEASKQDTQLRGGITRQMQQQQGATSEDEESIALTQGVGMGPGLINRTGEYNCFLNVIIQCLWHLTVFKQKLQREVPRHESYRAQHPVVASLLRLFKELEEGEMRIATDPKATRLLVDPSDLREALDAIPGKNIRMGEMSDPSEVLETLYECLDAGVYLEQRSIVDETFGLHVNEFVNCGQCKKISHQIGEHTELFHVIHVALLVYSEEGSLGRALQWSASQDVKRCDKDVGGCGAACTPVKRIHVMPQVFSIILAWEGSVDAATIQQAMSKVDTNLRLVEVYGPGPHPVEAAGLGSPADVEYKLRSMFCYYGQHYFAFILKPEVEQWVMFDDTTVSTIGSWEAVLAKCAKGRIQPCLLFYEQQ